MRKINQPPSKQKNGRKHKKCALPVSSKTKFPARTAPGERERVATLSHPVTRGGVGERSAPRLRRRKRNQRRNSPASSETKRPARTAPWESARGSQPSRTPVAPEDMGSLFPRTYYRTAIFRSSSMALVSSFTKCPVVPSGLRRTFLAKKGISSAFAPSSAKVMGIPMERRKAS